MDHHCGQPAAAPGLERARLDRLLRGSVFGNPWRLLDEVTSTNDIAWEWARSGAPEGAVVLAGAQTAGRGRSGRTWLSAAGAGLWFSVVLRPHLGYPDSGMLPLAVGVGVTLALRDLGLPARLKWPNDVLVRGRKVAGVLVEGRSSEGFLDVAVAGIGLNWTAPADPALAARATGLAAEFDAAGRQGPLTEEVFVAVLNHVERAYLILRGAGPAPFVAAWPRLSAHFARPVVVAVSGARTAALGGSLKPDGSLEVLLPDGRRHPVHAGDVSLRLEGPAETLA